MSEIHRLRKQLGMTGDSEAKMRASPSVVGDGGYKKTEHIKVT